MITECSIAATTHGRYLLSTSAALAAPSPGMPMLVGFHGYAEDADLHLERLRSIPDLDRWLFVSIQGLHRFYRGRSRDVVASWMTRQDRELMMQDNLAYVNAVIDEIRQTHATSQPLVFSGFSQGVAMAFRAAALGRHRATAVIALGGDVPPELDAGSLGRIERALVGRGDRDEWYTIQKHADDQARLTAAGVNVDAYTFDAGHEWTSDFSASAAAFLRRLA